jgi:2-oxoglutarate ferredoxin oxidoreductase subunit gamma
MRYEMRLSGSGGQGLVLAGRILAEAAALYDDLNATQSQSYGPEARGGASRSDVIISDHDIEFPKTGELDILLAFTQDAANNYIGELSENGLLVIDEEAVPTPPEGKFRIISVPFQRLAREKFDRAVVANIVACGVISELAGCLSQEGVRAATLSRVPRGTEEINLEALELGLSIGRSLTEDAENAASSPD